MTRTAEPPQSKILRRIEVTETGCWEWQGARTADGYGRLAMPSGKMGGRRDFAHRVSYEAFVGPIPEGLVIDHLCRNPPCCNPEHLEPVTPRINVLRGEAPSAENILKTHCKFGHEFTPENTRTIPTGRRCRACERRRANESRARRAAS